MRVEKVETIDEGVAPKTSRYSGGRLVFVYLGEYRRGNRVRVKIRDATPDEMTQPDEWWYAAARPYAVLEA